MGKYKDFIQSFSGLTGENQGKLEEFTQTLDSFQNIEEAGKALSLAGISREITEESFSNTRFANNTEGIQSILSTLPTMEEATTTTSQKIGYTFSGIGQSISAFASTAVGQVAIVTTALAGIGMIANALEGPSYEELQQQATVSAADYSAAQTESDTVKQNLADIDTRIREINSQPLALVNQEELSALQTQKKELEETATLKENLAKATQDKAALDASKAMDAKSSDNKALNSKIGGIGKWINEYALIQSDNPIFRISNPLLCRKLYQRIYIDSIFVFMDKPDLLLSEHPFTIHQIDIMNREDHLCI